MMKSSKHVSAGTRVRVAKPGPVPHWSTWDDDRQRASTAVKKRLQEMFFGQDRRIQAAVVFIGSESQRDELRRKNQVKVELRDAAGSRVVIVADALNLEAA